MARSLIYFAHLLQAMKKMTRSAKTTMMTIMMTGMFEALKIVEELVISLRKSSHFFISSAATSPSGQVQLAWPSQKNSRLKKDDFSTCVPGLILYGLEALKHQRAAAFFLFCLFLGSIGRNKQKKNLQGRWLAY
jgi:hypothetical protein